MQALKESRGTRSERIPRQETGTNTGQRAPAARLPCWLTRGGDRLSSLSGGPGGVTPSELRVFGNKTSGFAGCVCRACGKW